MAANDVYSVTVKMGEPGAQVINVFFYQASPSSASATAIGLRTSFDAAVRVAMQGILSTGLFFNSIDTVNLFDNSDFENYLYAVRPAGLRPGQIIPSFNAFKFKSAKPTSSQQPARKAFGYISETDVGGSSIVTGGSFQTAANTLATQLGTNLVLAGPMTFQPVIVRRIPYTTPSGKPAYRLPEGLGESTTFPAINWSYDTVIRPQVSRTFGRGN